MIDFGPDLCRSLEHASTHEWLETNGVGGFASSTMVGLNTRRYHGLLVAALCPPVGRMVLLSKLEETLVVDGRRFELSTNRYPGAVHPQGYRLLARFRLDPFPIFTYRVEDLELEKAVFMVHGENTTVVQYALTGSATRSASLELRPLVAFRDHHHLTHENPVLDPRVEVQETSLRIQPYAGLPALHLAYGPGRVAMAGSWYHRFEYDVERARGLDFVEDLFNPCALTFDVSATPTITVAASTEALEGRRLEQARLAEEQRRTALVASADSGTLARALVAAADQYIVRRGTGRTILAGYHWFTDWGRDAMIALPGLALVTGHHDAARDILLEFARHVDRGMIPNRFADGDEPPDYSSADATLWFVYAVQQFLADTGDERFVHERLYAVLADVLAWHVGGTRHGIRADSDGLLRIGPAERALTWMDVTLGGWMPTPRFGKPVEIEALWYNALRFVGSLAARLHDEPRRAELDALAGRARRAFNRSFWNEEASCLLDAVDGDARDRSVRPNQLVALSLPFSMVSDARARRALGTVERLLLTPYGLRTLAPADPRYRGRYEGNHQNRDAAYHQGTVWPWLLGPLVTAFLRLNPTPRGRQRAVAWLEGLGRHLLEAGLGQISEVFDGDPPHRPGGCIAQAWSVGELLRALRLVSGGGADSDAASR